MIILHVEFMINPSGSVSGGMKIGIYYSFEKKNTLSHKMILMCIIEIKITISYKYL